MNVLFIGLGSIARRHIANLKELLGNGVSVAVLRSGKGKDPGGALPLADEVYYEDSMLREQYDAVFVTNPTGAHYGTLLRYKGYSRFFFIEKPAFMTGQEDLSPFRGDGNVYYVACPLRYTETVRYLKESMDFSTVYAMRCTSSSYLPDWRPGTDYRDSYSAHKDMGGGVSIDLVHEWDYIHHLIGAPMEVKSILRKKSALEIDADDIAIYVAEYEDRVVEVHLDYFGRKPVRTIEMFGKDDTVVADLLHQKIRWMKEGRTMEFSEDRDGYQKRELGHFLDIMAGRCASDNDLETACGILRIAAGGQT